MATGRSRALVALLVVAAVAAIGGSSARATNLLCVSTVANGGNDAAAASGTGCYATVQAAIDQSGAGDTIQVGAGTFTETGHVLVQGKAGLTILGAGQGSTIIDTNVGCLGCGSASHTYGVLVEQSHDITLEGVTVIGPDAANSGGGHGTGYGFHDDDDTNIALVDVTVMSSARSNIDFNGTTGVTLTNVVATGAVYGTGISFTDTSNVTIDGVTTSGNAWGGIALYATGRYYACGVSNVSIANASLGEVSALYTEIDNTSNPACTITNLSVDPAELPDWVSLPNQVQPQNVYVKSLADATTVAAAQPALQPSVHAFTDSVATLSALSLSTGSLSPAFDPATTAYSATVDNGTSSVTVGQTASPGATVSVAGGSNLSVGANTVTVTVTSADQTASNVYTVTVTRAAPAPTPTTTIAATTTAAPTSPAAPTTAAPAAPAVTTPTSQPTEAAAVMNQPQSVAALPGQSGKVDVVVGSTAPTGRPGGTTAAAAPVSVGLSWSPTAFQTPVTVKMTPEPQPAAAAGATEPAPTLVAGGYTVGNTVVQVNVTTEAGAAVTQFASPLAIHISSLPAGQTPAYSHDGKAWTFIPRLATSDLPAGQQDGYFVNPDGSIDIYTRHATLFGFLLDSQAPSRPVVSARVAGTKLYLQIRAKDNARLASYRVLVNGQLVKRTTHAYLVLAARVGRFQVEAVDAAGNVGKPSAVMVVRTGVTAHSFRLNA